MFDLITQSILISSFILYFDFTAQLGNINDWYRKLLLNYFGDKRLTLEDRAEAIDSKWFKVLIGCIYCYQFWITLIIVFFINFFSESSLNVKKNVIFAIIEVFEIASLNYIFMKLFNKVTGKTQEIADVQAKLLLTNPKIWEKAKEVPLPTIEKEVVKKAKK